MIGDSTPLVDHTGKMRKRRQLHKRRIESAEDMAQEMNEDDKMPKTTRSGCKIKKPSRFLVVNSLKDYSSKRGEVVRTCEMRAEIV